MFLTRIINLHDNVSGEKTINWGQTNLNTTFITIQIDDIKLFCHSLQFAYTLVNFK